jgi:hypothetical protein
MITATTFAQQQGRRPQMNSQERAQKRAETMKIKLELSDAQYQTIYAQFLKTEQEMDRQREAMRKMREENDKVLKSTLTPEQYTKFKEFQEQRRKMRQGRNQDDVNDDGPEAPVGK